MDNPTTITLPRFRDMHCHFRDLPLLGSVVSQTLQYANSAVVMPNTRPRAILNGDDVVWYRDLITQTIDGLLVRYPFTPLMTIEIRDNTTPSMVEAAKKAGAVAGKVYPLGVTTNSDEGLRDFFSSGVLETFRAMQDIGMLLLIHGEISAKRVLVTEREEFFLPTFLKLMETLPDLKVVLEHISTESAVKTVKQLDSNVAATITAHHLWLTLNDVIGDGIRPHFACMPIAKGFDDRDALLEAATSGNPKFFLGSDTAPHPREKKECVRGACGVYSAPVLPQLLAEIFEARNALHHLADFTSRFGARFYGISIPDNEATITLVKEDWMVPEQIGGVVPFLAGTMRPWSLV